MNFSTNQVKQFYVLGADSVVTPKVIKTPDGETNKAVVLDIDGERTDIIPLDNILYMNAVSAGNQKTLLKSVTIKLNPDVNSGNPVSGQDYIITLLYRGMIGEEDTYHKFAEAHAYSGMTAAKLLQELAKSFIKNSTVEESPLYRLFLADGTTPVTESNVTSITDTGFVLAEPVPYWALGKFPETPMKMSISTKALTIDGEEVIEWLAPESYKFVGNANLAIPNTHKVADLEYFCKGEKGVSAFLAAPYDVQIPVNLGVNPNDANGYDILTIHYAFVGANAMNQKSEKDMVIVAPNGGNTSVNAKLTTIKAAIEALTVGGALADHEDRIEALENA